MTKKKISIIIASVVAVVLVTIVTVNVYNGKKAENQEIDYVIQNALNQAPPRGEKIDSVSANGMMVIIDFTGYVDDEKFEGGDAKDYPLILGSNQFIPGFEPQLVGKKAGDKVDVKVTFPKEYNSKDLANKDAVFKVVVKEVQKVIPNELNDEFVKSLQLEGVTTTKQLRKHIAKLIKEQKKVQEQQQNNPEVPKEKEANE